MKGLNTSHGRRRKSRGSIPNLRPPTMMIDLLFGALMLFAFQMGDPNSKSVIPHGIELPTDETEDTKKTTEILPLQPVSIGGGEWIYETNEGDRLTADEVAGRTKSGKIAPVLMLSKTISVQEYVDAETPLRKLGLKVGLAVTSDKEKTK